MEIFYLLVFILLKIFIQHFLKNIESHPSLPLIEDCCENFEVFIQNLENSYGDEEFMDEEILEALN